MCIAQDFFLIYHNGSITSNERIAHAFFPIGVHSYFNFNQYLNNKKRMENFTTSFPF